MMLHPTIVRYRLLPTTPLSENDDKRIRPLRSLFSQEKYGHKAGNSDESASATLFEFPQSYLDSMSIPSELITESQEKGRKFFSAVTRASKRDLTVWKNHISPSRSDFIEQHLDTSLNANIKMNFMGVPKTTDPSQRFLLISFDRNEDFPEDLTSDPEKKLTKAKNSSKSILGHLRPVEKVFSLSLIRPSKSLSQEYIDENFSQNSEKWKDWLDESHAHNNIGDSSGSDEISPMKDNHIASKLFDCSNVAKISLKKSQFSDQEMVKDQNSSVKKETMNPNAKVCDELENNDAEINKKRFKSEKTSLDHSNEVAKAETLGGRIMSLKKEILDFPPDDLAEKLNQKIILEKQKSSGALFLPSFIDSVIKSLDEFEYIKEQRKENPNDSRISKWVLMCRQSLKSQLLTTTGLKVVNNQILFE